MKTSAQNILEWSPTNQHFLTYISTTCSPRAILDIMHTLYMLRLMFVSCLFSLGVLASGTKIVSEDNLVEWPTYRQDIEEAEPSSTTVPETSFIQRKDCSNRTIPFSKHADVNGHPGFPLVPSTPIIEDQLNTSFFREKNTGTFFVTKWPSNSFPVVTFTITEESKKYTPYVRYGIDYINKKAREAGITGLNELFVALSNRTEPIEDESCNAHMIHFEESISGSQMSTDGGVTYANIETKDENRLGQILDMDIIINVKNIETFLYVSDKKSEAAKKAEIKKHIGMTVVHEILHALGLDHNFALGTLMDYKERFISSEYDISLAYEMEALRSLYKPSYKKSNEHWPLIRSTGRRYTYTPARSYAWENAVYKAKVNSKSLLCSITDSSSETMSLNLSSSLPDEFELRVEKEKCAQAFTECDLTKVHFDGLVDQKVFKLLPETHLYGSDFQRLSPVIHISNIFNDDSEAQATSLKNQPFIFSKNVPVPVGVSARLQKPFYLTLPSPFSHLYYRGKGPQINKLELELVFLNMSMVYTRDYPKQCLLQVQFDIDSEE